MQFVSRCIQCNINFNINNVGTLKITKPCDKCNLCCYMCQQRCLCCNNKKLFEYCRNCREFYSLYDKHNCKKINECELRKL